MADGTRPEPDPQDLLPADLRPAWAVVPRGTLYWLFAAGGALGAGAALSVVGFALGHDALRWGFPVALALVVLGRAVLVRAERRQLPTLRRRARLGVTAGSPLVRRPGSRGTGTSACRSCRG